VAVAVAVAVHVAVHAGYGYVYVYGHDCGHDHDHDHDKCWRAHLRVEVEHTAVDGEGGFVDGFGQRRVGVNGALEILGAGP
jgi:hypothetical protein